MKRIVFIVMLSILFSSSVVFAQQRDLPDIPVRAYPARKDPFVAGLLSWLMMGTGQMYCHEYTKGSIFIAADLLDKAALVLLISHINSTYAPPSGEIININWYAFDTETKALTILYFVGTLGLRFYNVIDAVSSANNFNTRYFSQKKPKEVSCTFEENKFILQYNFRFSE
jgi:hypothetical protein